jgi:uncharacterized cupin superfamily protein/GNAT superfamily N-acetyltransferase
MLDLFGSVFEDAATYGARRPGPAYVAQLLANPAFIALVALEEGCVVGALAAYELAKFEQERSEFYIYDLGVAETHRRRGIAAALIADLRAVARECQSAGLGSSCSRRTRATMLRSASTPSWACAKRFCTSTYRSKAVDPVPDIRNGRTHASLRLQEDSAMKSIMNLDDVQFEDVEENGLYTSSRAQISDHIGAMQLGYNLTVLPPGKVQCPFHCHHGEEEMFLILEGEGELRLGDQRYPIRKHDVIACPTGGPEVAHQIINTGATTMRYLALSTLSDVETCEYPDSQKISIVTGRRGEPGLRKIFRAENTVDYYDREKS